VKTNQHNKKLLNYILKLFKNLTNFHLMNRNKQSLNLKDLVSSNFFKPVYLVKNVKITSSQV